MTTSDQSWSPKLREITALERPDHYYLNECDKCLYFGEYTARRGWAHSQTNGIISNLKKSGALPRVKGFEHKGRVIRGISKSIAQNLAIGVKDKYCIVPIPPSKRPDHAEYDDRMWQICQRLNDRLPAIDLLETIENRGAAHLSNNSRDPAALQENIRVKNELIPQVGARTIILLDDVVVTGSSYIACKNVLEQTFNPLGLLGIFVARRVPERGLNPLDFMNL